MVHYKCVCKIKSQLRMMAKQNVTELIYLCKQHVPGMSEWVKDTWWDRVVFGK